MKKSQLRNIIRELITEQINPSDARRIYGCACSAQHQGVSSVAVDGVGIVMTQAEIQAYNAAGTDQQNPFVSGTSLTGAVWHDYGNGSVNFLPVGPNQDLYLICPESYWFNHTNAIIDCDVPQEGQTYYQEDGTGENVTIAINGVMSEWNTSQPIKSFHTAACGGSGVIPHDCTPPPVTGCMDSLAINFNYTATIDSGTCEYDFSDPTINQMTRICTCEDNPIDVTGQPNNYFACNGGQPLGIPLRFSDATPPAINLINHQAQVGNLINNVPPNTDGTFPSSTLWVIVDVLAVGSGGAATVAFQNTNGCPTNLPTSGNVPGIGYVGVKPTDIDKEPSIRGIRERFIKLANIKKLL